MGLYIYKTKYKFFSQILTGSKHSSKWMSKRRKEYNERQTTAKSVVQQRRVKRENSLTKMLLCVIMIFMLCNLGQGICDWIFFYSGESSILADGISALLLMFNSSVNFIIYCTMGTKFRDQLIRIIPPWCLICCKKRPYSIDNLSSDAKNLSSNELERL